MSEQHSLKDFEKDMSQLEDILQQMASDETTLEQSVQLYARAAALIEGCNAMLGAAKVQVEEISDRLNAGEAQNGV